jgi:5-methylcytosine-specific restriction endonuclease McrA
MEQFTRKCQWCLKEFQTEWATKEYCTRSHKEQARMLRKRNRQARKPSQIFIKECIGCGHNFSTKRTDKLYCTKDCREWITQQIKRERDKAYHNARTPSFKRRIFFASDGACGICNQPIDLRLKWPDPMSYSIDHIVPRSLGGSHAANNLRAAHNKCNASRGNRVN